MRKNRWDFARPFVGSEGDIAVSELCVICVWNSRGRSCISRRIPKLVCLSFAVHSVAKYHFLRGERRLFFMAFPIAIVFLVCSWQGCSAHSFVGTGGLFVFCRFVLRRLGEDSAPSLFPEVLVALTAREAGTVDYCSKQLHHSPTAE